MFFFFLGLTLLAGGLAHVGKIRRAARGWVIGDPAAAGRIRVLAVWIERWIRFRCGRGGQVHLTALATRFRAGEDGAARGAKFARAQSLADEGILVGARDLRRRQAGVIGGRLVGLSLALIARVGATLQVFLAFRTALNPSETVGRVIGAFVWALEILRLDIWNAEREEDT